jgi:hypothetical protein
MVYSTTKRLNMHRQWLTPVATISLMLTLHGCSTAPVPQDHCVPRDEAPGMPVSASSYAELCSRLLGEVPTADCGEGVRIPVTVNDIEVFETPPDNACDNTGFKGACDPGSTLRRQQGRTLNGDPRPEVVWITFCRAVNPAYASGGLGSVQMIGHDMDTGATCFFESPDAIGSQAQAQWVAMDADGILDGTLPGPGDPEFDDAWMPPPSDAPCAQCHHNDPFIHNPWIDGARLPDDPTQPVLPVLATPDSPYWIVGGPYWDLRTPHIEGNQCTSCHRVGTGTIDIFNLLGQIDVNDLMPPSAPGTMPDEVEALQQCWESGPDDATGCEWVNPPGAYCD